MSQNASKRAITICVVAVGTLAAVPVFAQAPAKPPGGSVTLPVQVGNTPSVNVANTPTGSVNVTNPLDGQGNPTPLATLEAVQLYGSLCEIDFLGLPSGHCYQTAIPQGKQLYIQEFDAAGDVETGSRPLDIVLEGTIAGYNFFPYTFMGNVRGRDFLATHQETRLYVLPGSAPTCVVDLAAPSNGAYFCSISGFLVDVPSGQQAITVQHPKFPLSELLRHLPGK